MSKLTEEGESSCLSSLVTPPPEWCRSSSVARPLVAAALVLESFEVVLQLRKYFSDMVEYNETVVLLAVEDLRHIEHRHVEGLVRNVDRLRRMALWKRTMLGRRPSVLCSESSLLLIQLHKSADYLR